MLLTALRKAEAARGGRKVPFFGLLPSMVNPFDRREMENAVKLAHAVGRSPDVSGFHQGAPDPQAFGGEPSPRLAGNGKRRQGGADEIRAVLAEIERRVSEHQAEAAQLSE